MFHSKNNSQTIQNHSGFTLVEMLVSVGLLIVVMTIFAEIFSLAVTAMTRQKGLANNDQQARTAFVAIDNDLKRMSYRAIDGQQGIVPLVPGLNYNTENAAPEQAGYFYYSENDPNDVTDDVLQFTIQAEPPSSSRYSGQDLDYYGKAEATLGGSLNYRDQPVWDDGSPTNGVSVSQQAEVVYFLRHGTLYRRVLLLRDANSIPNDIREFDKTDEQKRAQPGRVNGSGNEVDLMTGYSGNFYTDFDFSAHYGDSPYTGNPVALFHGTLSNTTGVRNWPLGIPHFRFGHSPTSGLPREFLTDGTTNYFLGRYTHDETSSPAFQYPHTTTGGVFGGTLTPSDTSNFLGTGRLNTIFSGGTRRGEDVLLYNVHSFDVEIWDASVNGGVGGFVDIDSTAARDFGSRNGTNQHAHEISTYGPSNGTVLNNINVFDTWHSDFPGAGFPGLAGLKPPATPLKRHPNDATVPIYVPAVNRVNRWSPGDNLTDKMYCFPTDGSADYSNCIVWQAEFQNDLASPPLPSPPVLGATEPAWDPTSVSSINLQAGITVNDTNDYDGIPGNNPDVIWRAVDNRKPVRALRITILFRDPTSNQMRQETIVHSFNE